MTTTPSTATGINSITKKINDLTAIQRELQSDLHHVNEDLRVLTESRRKLLARQFIIENGVKSSQVWMSDHPCTVGLHAVYQLVDWIAKQKENRPYLEWNGIIFPFNSTLSVRLIDSDNLRFIDILDYELEQAEKGPK